MKKLILALLGICFLAAPAWAHDDPNAEFFAGYSYRHVDLIVVDRNAHGFHFAGAGYFNKYFALEGDVSGHYGSVAGVNFQNYLVMGGPKVTARFERVTPFAHALFGLNNIRGGGLSSSDFALGAGGGLDVNATPHVAIRVGQVDYIYVRVREGTLRENTNGFRASFGVVFKW